MLFISADTKSMGGWMCRGYTPYQECKLVFPSLGLTFVRDGEEVIGVFCTTDKYILYEPDHLRGEGGWDLVDAVSLVVIAWTTTMQLCDGTHMFKTTSGGQIPVEVYSS